jgi:hypothetical protein
MGWNAFYKGRESSRSSASVPMYLIVVGQPALGLASLTRHGETKPVGGRIQIGKTVTSWDTLDNLRESVFHLQPS